MPLKKETKLSLKIFKLNIFNVTVNFRFGLVWFGLVSFFNGISTFVGHLMPKPFS